MSTTFNAVYRDAIADIDPRFAGSGRTLKRDACRCRYQRANRHHPANGTGCIRRIRRISGFLVLLLPSFVSSPGRASTIGSPITANGYTFTNFDPTLPGGFAASNVNGISNTGQTVGVAFYANGNVTNFAGTPVNTTQINTAGGAMAFGINSAGDVVGQGVGPAFFLPSGGAAQPLAMPVVATNAFGINDKGNIVGQFNLGLASPGFFLQSNAGNGFLTINAPSGPNIVNAQGINDNGLVVGFYLGNDGQDHGFRANLSSAQNGSLTGIALADPAIPNVPGEPGATFVFSQILGVNDSGLAVGYYGDSTTSQHGFLYNTNTGMYTFLDDPAEQFNNGGVEVTHITGINNSDEIAGFYSDAAGTFHSFVACPTGLTCSASAGSAVPEPSCLLLASVGLGALGLFYVYRRRNAQAA